MGKLKKVKKAKAKKQSPEEKFNEALRRMQRIEEQNAKFVAEVDALVARVRPQIREAELRRYTAMEAFALRLLSFTRMKSLTRNHKQVLVEWLDELLMLMSNHPFADEVDTAELKQKLAAEVNWLRMQEQEGLLAVLRDGGAAVEELAEIEKLMAELATTDDPGESWVKLQEKIAAVISEGELGPEDEFFQEELFDLDEDVGDLFDEDAFDEDDFFDFEEALEDRMAAAREEEDAELSRLLKSTQLNQLFRRTAKALHPDLEQDEDLKREKHAKMSALVEARDSHDVARMIGLYSETFGTLPEDFPSADYLTLTKIINRKIERLRDSKMEALRGKPYHAHFYDFFHGRNEASSVQEFIANRLDEAQMYLALSREVSSLKALRPMLVMRERLLDVEDEALVF